MARERGLRPSRQIALPDHADAHQLDEALSDVAGEVLCTEKDAVKLFPWWRALPQPRREHLRIGAVPLVTDIDAGFFDALDSALSSAHGHQTA